MLVVCHILANISTTLPRSELSISSLID